MADTARMSEKSRIAGVNLPRYYACRGASSNSEAVSTLVRRLLIEAVAVSLTALCGVFSLAQMYGCGAQVALTTSANDSRGCEHTVVERRDSGVSHSFPEVLHVDTVIVEHGASQESDNDVLLITHHQSKAARALTFKSRVHEAIEAATLNIDSPVTVFNVPPRMLNQEEYVVYLNVFVRDSVATRAFTFGGESAQPQYNHIRKIAPAPWLRARVQGSEFKVSALTDSIQLLNVDGVTTWRWTVVPLSTDAKRLTLTIDGMNGKTDDTTSVTMCLLTESVTVSTDWVREVRQNWYWLATTIVLPIGKKGWGVWRKLRRMRRMSVGAPTQGGTGTEQDRLSRRTRLRG